MVLLFPSSLVFPFIEQVARRQLLKTFKICFKSLQFSLILFIGYFAAAPSAYTAAAAGLLPPLGDFHLGAVFEAGNCYSKLIYFF